MGGEHLEIRLLGEMAVSQNGEIQPLPQSKKTRALLAYLALSEGPHRRERLCELFWEVPDDPRGALRWSLSKLRRIVNNENAERIKADRNTVAFVRDRVDVDILSIREQAENVASMSTADLGHAAMALQDGLLNDLSLSRQDDFETWRLAEIEQARRVHVALLAELEDRRADDPSATADVLTRRVAIDPYNIEAHRRLVDALARAGRATEAERQRDLSCKTLDGVDGFAPSMLDGQASQRAATPDGQPQQTGQEAPLTSRPQTIRFCKTKDGVQIAFASVGEGPPLVKAANWLNHLEFDWESPVWTHVFRALMEQNRLVRYDARGNGLSDWRISDFSLERQVEDLEAVIDAAGLDRFSLIGISQGCAIGIEFAARHPEKVDKLVLYGGYARGWKKRKSDELRKNTEAMITLMRNGWGQDNPAFRQMFASLFMPDAPFEHHAWFNELQRLTTSPENAAALLQALGDVDVIGSLEKVRAPTLVAHAAGDLRSPFDEGKDIAAGIPDARFITLDTNNHLIPENDPAWPQLRDAVTEFLRG